MRFFEVTDNTAKGSADPVIIEAPSEESARDTFAREWLGMESWTDALGDGVDAAMFTFTQVNHGPATEFPGQVHLRTPAALDKFTLMRGDVNFSHLTDAQLRKVVDGPVSGVVEALASGPMNAKKPPALKTFPKPAQRKRHR